MPEHEEQDESNTIIKSDDTFLVRLDGGGVVPSSAGAHDDGGVVSSPVNARDESVSDDNNTDSDDLCSSSAQLEIDDSICPAHSNIAPSLQIPMPMMPTIRKWVKGPMWLHFLVGAPPVLVFSAGCAGLAGGAVPAIAQLTSSSYHATMSSRHPISHPSPKDDQNAQV
ncbi:hypothetical protein Droror1_Dr00025480 [Drosera rotundifolia]